MGEGVKHEVQRDEETEAQEDERTAAEEPTDPEVSALVEGGYRGALVSLTHPREGKPRGG